MSKPVEEDQNFEEELLNSDLYTEEGHWHVNAGGNTIHASRIPGFFRNLRWYAQSIYFFFFIGPYLQWNGQRSIYFDIPHRQFHLFGITVWPQDIWMLAVLLIMLAISLVAVTAIAGRVFCGYFCFHMVWVDWFTLVEKYLEGTPSKRRKLDAESWGLRKITLRLIKYVIWLSIGLFTAFTITAYFMDTKELLNGYLHLNAPPAAWGSLLINTIGVFVFTGFMREQVCFWLCPYARIQSVMIDRDTVWPTYDAKRGEPRTKYARGPKDSKAGDCINCNLCFNVCPTGVDIRNGMQEGCITCGMCIDACDTVMGKIKRPKGLIRYVSRNELSGKIVPGIYKRPRVIIYTTIILLALSGIVYGLNHIAPLEFTILHDRMPVYTEMSDGSIQNKYTIKILNKTPKDLLVSLNAEGVDGLKVISEQGEAFVLPAGKMIPFHVFLRVNQDVFKTSNLPVKFRVKGLENKEIDISYKSMLIGPKS
ncbi:MAG: cytochrome c oxidase accessory protein CcoG [Spirochaetia bacterium]|nr:cytochrome c oxidase accessory protein CcoG [Spirochaetia bacterium]